MKTSMGVREWLFQNNINLNHWWDLNGDALSQQDLISRPNGVLFSGGEEITIPELHAERIGFRRLSEDLPYKAPSRGTGAAAGYDLFCSEETLVQYGVISRVPTNTGLIWEWPYDVPSKIEDKSGLALKEGIHNLGGRIDGDYRWNETGDWRKFEIGVIQTCLIPGGFKLYKVGDKVAQLVLGQLVVGDDRVGVTRSGGFGSTGAT